MLYQVPSTAICWSVYEFFKYYLNKEAVRVDSSSVTYDKIDAKPSGTGSGFAINPVNSLASSGNSIELIPQGSNSALSAARALGVV